ncbi:MAG: NAD-dependent deacylase [Bacteroidia bacterium]|nr:NAD-dependent deacylase [Bacteroidia bacterium]
MKRIVVLSGAGISAESGLKTFRDSDGLWENYRIEDVATPQAWKKDRNLVLQFYNERRKQVKAAQPNAAHLALVQLEEKFDVHIVTQNIDDLHERAGSKKVLHLHGEILKSRSTMDPHLVYAIEKDELNEGEKCELGSQLRPHIVWFGEMVPALEDAAYIVSRADILIVVGTSLAVYPAAGLVNYVSPEAKKYVVNPDPIVGGLAGFKFINAKAGIGIPELVIELIKS